AELGQDRAGDRLVAGELVARGRDRYRRRGRPVLRPAGGLLLAGRVVGGLGLVGGGLGGGVGLRLRVVERGLLRRARPLPGGDVELALVQIVEVAALCRVGGGVVLLGLPVDTEREATHQTQREQSEGDRTGPVPAPEPTHEPILGWLAARLSALRSHTNVSFASGAGPGADRHPYQDGACARAASAGPPYRPGPGQRVTRTSISGRLALGNHPYPRSR